MSRSYLGSYSNDVFISYTHVDNRPFGAESIQWIEHLHEQLRIRLEQYLGATVSVWRDRKLAGNDLFGQEIFDQISQCALLVSVCSPRYLNSEWCIREIESFSEHNRSVLRDNQTRIFKVLKTPVNRSDLPEVLQPILGYVFYREDDAGDRIREYLLEPPSEWWRFYAAVDDLAQDISKTLAGIRKEDGRTVQRAEPRGATVYLATTSSDVSSYRDEIRRDLERRGHTVLPSKPLPLIAETLLTQTREYLQQSTVSVHLLGARYDMRPEGDKRSYAHVQIDLANELAVCGELHQYIWSPAGIAAVDDEAVDLLARFERGLDLGDNTEYFSTGIEELKTALNARLDGQPDGTVVSASQNADAVVYLLFDRGDYDAASAIKAYLESFGCVVLVPEQSGDSILARRIHEESLVLCEAVLIYHGTATDHWLTMALRDLLKARGWGRTDPFRSTVVFLGPPATAAKVDYRSAQARVLHGLDGDLTGLDVFVEAIR